MNATGIQTVQQDNAQAFDRQAREQQDWLYNLAYRLTGDAQVASAAVEQTLDLAWRDLPALQNGSASLWLAGIAVSACCAELRRRKNPSVTGTAAAADPALVQRGSPPTGGPLNQTPTEEEVQCCLDRLPLEERTVLALVDVLGLNYAEAAQVTGERASAVSRRLARGRTHLAELLKAQG